jgi:hypothetical protein
VQSGFSRQGAEAQSLFGFAKDLTDRADFTGFFMVGGSRVSLITQERSEPTK